MWLKKIVLLVVFANTAVASVGYTAERFSWERDPVFLSKTAIDVSTVSPPPKASSKQDLADIQEILAVQRKRSVAECDRAKTEVQVSLASFFGPPYGPLKAEEVKRWAPFFEKIRPEVDYFVQEVKRKWKRPRPYAASLEVKPCTPLEKTDAYPSGHAAISRLFADVLSKMDPERRQVFEDRARQIAADRVLAGVHHPTDIEAGRKLGDQVFKVLWQEAAFQKELSALRGRHEN